MPRPPGIWRRKGREGWWATIRGKQVSLGDDHATAQREWHRLRGSTPQVEPSRATVAELVDEYLGWVERRVKPPTYHAYHGYLQSWVNHAGRLQVSAVAIGHVQDWIDGQGWAQSSRSLALSVLRIWARWCEDRGYYIISTIMRVKKPSILRREPPAPGALETVLGAILSPDFRDFAAVLLDVGCRPGELSTLEASRINWEQSTAWVQGKTGRRLVGLTAQAVAILRRHAERHPAGPVLRNSNGDPWLPEAISGQMWRARQRVRRETGRDPGPVVSYHCRHAFWGRAHKAGLDSLVIAKQMGHANLNMLSRHYAHVEPDMLRHVAQTACDNPAKSD